jgi:hypothetical protein
VKFAFDYITSQNRTGGVLPIPLEALVLSQMVEEDSNTEEFQFSLFQYCMMRSKQVPGQA